MLKNSMCQPLRRVSSFMSLKDTVLHFPLLSFRSIIKEPVWKLGRSDILPMVVTTEIGCKYSCYHMPYPIAFLDMRCSATPAKTHVSHRYKCYRTSATTEVLGLLQLYSPLQHGRPQPCCTKHSLRTGVIMKPRSRGVVNRFRADSLRASCDYSATQHVTHKGCCNHKDAHF